MFEPIKEGGREFLDKSFGSFFIKGRKVSQMDGSISRAEHEAFSDLMKAENKRIEEENNRQNKRLEMLETNMNQIIVQQLTNITTTIEKLNLSVGNMLKEQAEFGERLRKLENRDGDMWRKVISHIVTAVVGAVVCYFLTKLGM